MSFKEFCKDVENKIINSYENGVTLEEAEKLAGEFLYAQMRVSEEIKRVDLDARMRKAGLKAVRAAVYRESTDAPAGARRVTEAAMEHIINSNELVQGEHEDFDKAEVERDSLSRLYNVFREAHIYFRGIAKGRFE